MTIPKISIIIATFNSEKTLRVALDSIKAQSFQLWECLIIDGASNDETLKIVEEYEIIDSRFRHISEPDNGIYDAFNKGWRIAQGEWIYYLGADDVIKPEGLVKLLEDSKGADVVFGDLEIKYPNGKKRIQDQPYPSLRPVRLPSHQSIITRKQYLEKNGGFDEKYKIIADKDMTITIYRQNGVFRKVDTIVATFTLGGTSSNFPIVFKENLYFAKKQKLGSIAFYLEISYVYIKELIRSMLF